MVPWRRNLYILVAAQIVSMAGFSLVFPFLPLYVKELGVSTAGSTEFWSGLVFSAQALTMMISAPLWGVVADRFGRKLMLVRATLGGAVLLAGMGFAQNVEQLALLRALQGMVTGTIPAASALVAASAPREHSGEALGMLQTGAWIGVAVGPLLGGVIGDAVGFRESFWVTGGLLGLSGLAVLFWVNETFQPNPKGRRPGLIAGYRKLLQSPRMMTLYTITFLQAVGRMVIMPIAGLFIMQLMGTNRGAATVTGIMMGAMAVSSSLSAVWLGRLGDRIGHDRVLMASVSAAVVFYLPQAVVTAPWQLVVMQALTGVANGGLIPSATALMNLQTPTGNQGAAFGLNASVTAAGRSLAPMLGASMAIWFGMRSVFLVAACIYAAAAIAALAILRASAGRSY